MEISKITDHLYNRNYKNTQFSDSTGNHVNKKSILSENAYEKNNWTVMFYFAGDNDLKEYMIKDMNELESVGPFDRSNFIAMFDQGKTNCKLYEIKKDNDPDKITSAVLKKMGDTDMSDPKILTDFIKFSMKKYPAEHYALVVSDHGGAWTGAIQDKAPFDWMSMKELKDSIENARKESGNKIDVLAFDACNMANTEVAYEIKDQVDLIVASEESLTGDGWDYSKIFSMNDLANIKKKENKNIEPEDFSERIVSTAFEDVKYSTMSAIKTKDIDVLAGKLKEFSKKTIDEKIPPKVLENLLVETHDTVFERDLGDFLNRFSQSNDIKSSELKDMAKNISSDMNKIVLFEKHSAEYQNVTGITVQLDKIHFSEYKTLDFAKDTGWDKLIDYIDREY